MTKRRKKKIVRPIHLSAGPLPARLCERFGNVRLIFTDASQIHHGGLAAVLFDEEGLPPVIALRTVPRLGSNQLEFQAAILGLELVMQNRDDRPFALFSDNQDTVLRLCRAKTEGLQHDPELACRLQAAGIAEVLERVSFHWIPGHSSCRGNALADRHAREAAIGSDKVGKPIIS